MQWEQSERKNMTRQLPHRKIWKVTKAKMYPLKMISIPKWMFNTHFVKLSKINKSNNSSVWHLVIKVLIQNMHCMFSILTKMKFQNTWKGMYEQSMNSLWLLHHSLQMNWNHLSYSFPICHTFWEWHFLNTRQLKIQRFVHFSNKKFRIMHLKNKAFYNVADLSNTNNSAPINLSWQWPVLSSRKFEDRFEDTGYVRKMSSYVAGHVLKNVQSIKNIEKICPILSFKIQNLNNT